jgi:predicted permease
MAAVSIAPLVPVYNVVAVLVLLAGRHEQGATRRQRWARVGVGVVSNPLVLACVAGVLWSLTGAELPKVASRTLSMAGQMALPLALLGVGASLHLGAVRESLAAAGVAAVLKVVAGPVAGLLIARAMGLGDESLRVALLFLASPTAVTSFVMADQLGADRRLASNIVVLSTVMAVVPLAVILAVF